MPRTREKAWTRVEVGEFLRDRRAKLTPAAVGLRAIGARRTPGLRREEVAAIAGVSLTWYTWLEQGRDVRVSREVLALIAKALRLSKAEQRHLFALTQEPLDLEARESDESLPASMARLLRTFDVIPAYVTEDARWNVVGQSRGADALYGFSSRPRAERNVLRVLFTEPALRTTLVNWRAVAEDTVARFRHATAGHVKDRRRAAFLEELSRESEEFRAIWRKIEVRERPVGAKTFQFPRLGELELEHHAFRSHAREELSIIVYSPRAVTDLAKLRRLVARVSPSGERSL